MLPKGWIRCPIHEMGSVHAGRQRSPGFSKGKLMPYLRVANVFDGWINLSDVYTMHFTEDEFERYKLEPGDILLNEGQSVELVGRPAMYMGPSNTYCFQNTLVRFTASERVLPQFALLKFQQCLYDGTFQSIAKKTTSIAHLGVSRFAELELAWPPISEQHEIVQKLEAWSSAISITEKLLANSRRQKEALTYDLLMGRTRRTGFARKSGRVATRVGTLPQDWKHIPISEVASEVSIKNAADEALPVLSCTKHQGLVDSLSYFNKRVFSENTSTYKIVPRGAFAYATNHIDEGSIGYQDLYDQALISPMYTVFQVNERIDHGFLFKLLKTEHYRQVFAANTNASVDRRGSLRWNEFRKIEIPVPSLEEQLAINEVLDAANQEIEQLAAQLEALKAEKRVLMADLLTGKRRVRLPDAAIEEQAAA